MPSCGGIGTGPVCTSNRGSMRVMFEAADDADDDNGPPLKEASIALGARANTLEGLNATIQGALFVDDCMDAWGRGDAPDAPQRWRHLCSPFPSPSSSTPPSLTLQMTRSVDGRTKHAIVADDVMAERVVELDAQEEDGDGGEGGEGGGAAGAAQYRASLVARVRWDARCPL